MATLSAGGDVDLLAQQAVATRAPLVAVASASREEVTTAIGAYVAQAGLAAYRPGGGGRDDAAVEAARTGADVVLNGITGSIGLRPTLAALESGDQLANKESLIVGGPLVKALARPGQIVLVDSEHSAIAQSLRGGGGGGAPARGHGQRGPFRGRSREELRSVTPTRPWRTRTSRWGG